jgi:CheY-like chemotaxis protein
MATTLYSWVSLSKCLDCSSKETDHGLDISMPIMNGFEATRAIREVEHTRRTTQGDGRNPAGTRPNKALIIALTGLASSRDQTEAYNSGVDIFMTKPVSFKEVGRLLDNWEAHGSDTP